MLVTTRKSRAPEQVFAIAQTAAQLGYFTKLPGAHMSVVPDAEYPWPVHLVKQIRAEFDPAFVPAFVRQPWMTPAGTLVITGRHMACRYRPVPTEDCEPLHELILPCSSIGGMFFKHPILESTTLEVKDEPGEYETAMKQNTGVEIRRELGGYVPFDARVVNTFRAIWHQNHSKKAKDIGKELMALQVGRPATQTAALEAAAAGELREKWNYLERLRQTETEDDRRKAAAPRAPRPFAFLGRAS